MIRYFFSLCLYFLLIAILPAAAQLKTKVNKAIRVPRSMVEDTSAAPIYTTAKLLFSNGVLADTMLFIRTVPPPWQAAIIKLLPIYKAADWKQIFPASEHQQNFDVYLPFLLLRHRDTGTEDISAWKRRYLLDKDIAVTKGQFPFYTQEITVVESYMLCH